MARADEYIAMLDDPEAPAPMGIHPADPVLLQILVHLACSDGVVQEEELELLLEILPGRDTADILEMVSDVASRPLDFELVAKVLDTPEERAGALAFAARLVWADDVLDPREEALLGKLAETLDLSGPHLSNVLDQVLREPIAPVVAGKVAAAARELDDAFAAAEVEGNPLYAELADVVPEGATPVARVLIDGQERMALYDLGLAAHFAEGKAFIAWNDVAYYTRVPLFGAAVRVMTKDQQTFSITDRRLAAVSSILDRVFGGAV